MSIMKHDQYVARVEFDEEEDLFHGRVINTRDVITFYGGSVRELRREFAKSIKAHLLFCKEQGIDPSRPYSGRIPLRIDPDLHRRADTLAARAGKSLNAFIGDTLAREAEETV